MFDIETWKYINTFAPWLSAVGTFAAVVTSLYLARKSDRISLSVSADIRILAVENAGPGHGTEYVWVTIRNIGRRSATLTNLSWKFNPFIREVLIWLVPRNPFSSQFPVTINDGQTANYALPVEEFVENFRDYARAHLAGKKKSWKKFFARIYVATSAGNVVSARIAPSLWDLLRRI